jgi:glycosyltransferase involved in cell wall biosynthesis
MKVLVNQTTALRQKAGMGHYIAQLVRCLPLEAGTDQILLYPGRWTQAGLEGWKSTQRFLGRIRKPGPAASSGPASESKRAWKNAWGRRLLAWHFQLFGAGRDFDLYHEPNYIPQACNRPTITTVADLSLLLHPEWHPAERANHFARYFPKGLAQCAHVITISEFSRQEIMRHLQIPAERITCTHMGIKPGLGPLPRNFVLKVLERLGLPENYLLYVGTLEPRKNLLLLLQAYCDMPEAVRRRSPLVLAGGWGWNTGDLAEFYHAHAKHKGVIHLGYAAEADLPALYNGACALVFPTHYEGFGMPVLEMMACGGPVLSSTAGALVEIGGSRAHFLEPLDRDAWRQAMERIIVDQDWWQELRRGVEEVARPFTWERCASATWKVYRHVAGLSASLASLPKAA